MGGPLNHPTPQDMSDWMRLMERRIVTQERREPTYQVMQRLGPGLSRFAHQVFDWNTENTWNTGHYWSDIGSLHSPDDTKQWLGFTRVAADEGGVQELVTLDGTIRKQRPFSFNPGDELPTFGDWVDMGGGGSGGGPPTGAAGGDLDGFYPNPEIAAGAVGTLELANDSVTSAKIVDHTIQAVDLAPGLLADEVTIDVNTPAEPNTFELWYDPDAVMPPGPSLPDIAYTFTQGTASTVWVIPHPLSFQPNVTVVDSSGAQVEGDVAYTSSTSLTITFTAAFSGTAYLS